MGLLFSRGPSDVARLIVSVYIYPINGMLGRRFAPDFRKELLERREAELDSTTPIVFPALESGPFATLPSAMIRRIFGSLAITYVSPVLVIWTRFVVKASTRLRMFAGKVAGRNDGHGFAVALAEPVPMAFIPRIECDHEQAAEALTCHVNETTVSGWGRIIRNARMKLRHILLLESRMCLEDLLALSARVSPCLL